MPQKSRIELQDFTLGQTHHLLFRKVESQLLLAIDFLCLESIKQLKSILKLLQHTLMFSASKESTAWEV